MTIGNRIKNIMETKRITQKELCEKTGIPQSTVSEWTRNNKCPAADKIMIICKALEITPYELLQDTMELGTEHDRPMDYAIAVEGTDRYMLLEMYDRMSSDMKNRVLGYIEALLTN